MPLDGKTAHHGGDVCVMCVLLAKKSSEWEVFVPPKCTSVNLIVYYGCPLSTMDAVSTAIFDGGGK